MFVGYLFVSFHLVEQSYTSTASSPQINECVFLWADADDVAVGHTNVERMKMSMKSAYLPRVSLLGVLLVAINYFSNFFSILMLERVFRHGHSFLSFTAPENHATSLMPVEDVQIGFCLVGGLRSFQTKYVRDNLRVNLVEPLQEKMGAVVHTFGCFQLTDDPRIAGEQAPPVSAAKARSLLATLNSNKTVFIETSELAPRNCTNPADNSCLTEQEDRLAQAWSRISKCFAKLEIFERWNMTRPYDWIIRGRPDIVFLSPIPRFDQIRSSPRTIFVSAHHVGPISDHFWVVRRDYSNETFHCPMRHIYNRETPSIGQSWGSELVFLHCLNAHSLKVFKLIALPFAVTDYWHGLQCHRLNLTLPRVAGRCENATQEYLSETGLG